MITEVDGRPAGEVYLEKLEEIIGGGEDVRCGGEHVYKDLPPVGVARVLRPDRSADHPRTSLEVTEEYIQTAGYVVRVERLLLEFERRPNAPMEAYRESLSSGDEPLASVLATCAGRKPLREKLAGEALRGHVLVRGDRPDRRL